MSGDATAEHGLAASESTTSWSSVQVQKNKVDSFHSQHQFILIIN